MTEAEDFDTITTSETAISETAVAETAVAETAVAQTRRLVWNLLDETMKLMN